LKNHCPESAYDLVEHNLSVNEVAEEVKNLFPDLKMLFVNQHMQLRNVRVQADADINARFKSHADFASELSPAN